MILDPLASHPISAFCASFLNKRPTPSECGASSSSCPEYNINSPVVNRSCPDWVHRVSQSPSTVRLNISISAVTWAVFPLRTLFARSKCRCSKFSWSKEGQLALWLPFGFHRNTSYVVFFTRWGAGPTLDPPPFSNRAWDRPWRSWTLKMPIVYCLSGALPQNTRHLERRNPERPP